MDPFKEKAVGCSMVAGLVISIISFILMWVFGAAGVYHGTLTREPITNRITDAGDLNLVPITAVFLTIGVLLMLGSVGYGLWINAHTTKGPRQTVPHSKILARYGVDANGHTLTEDYQLEFAEKPRYYVRMQTGPAAVSEYECSLEVFHQCGEGLNGEAELQGRWLGKFTPYIGLPTA